MRNTERADALAVGLQFYCWCTIWYVSDLPAMHLSIITSEFERKLHQISNSEQQAETLFAVFRTKCLYKM